MNGNPLQCLLNTNEILNILKRITYTEWQHNSLSTKGIVYGQIEEELLKALDFVVKSKKNF